jgi:iron complex outermembrane receptor protein
MRAVSSLFVLGFAALVTTPLHGQEAPAQEPQPAVEPAPQLRGIEEIIVTAERREQNLQDVAQTITSFTPQDLETANIQDAYDLQLKVPGLVATGGLPAITLRGLGQDSDVLGPGIDPGFQLHINDIYVAQLAVALLAFNDLEEVSVLPGPQGTGFGRNSTGGSMNIRTKRPVLGEWELSGDFDYSSFDNIRLGLVANLPFYEKGAFRLAYRREFPSNYFDVRGQNGHRQHLTNNALSGGHNVRGSIRYVPTETVTLDLILGYGIDKDDGGTPRPLGPYPAFNPGQSTIFFGGVNPTGATPNPSKASDVNSDRRQSQQYETFWGQAILEWEIPKHIIKLNGNYQYWDFAIDRDQDFTDNDAIRLVLLDTHRTWSGEATIRSEYEGKFNWLFGANYQDDSAPDTDVPVWHFQADAELANFAVFDVFGGFSAFTPDAQAVCNGPCLFRPGDPDRAFIRFKSDVDTETAGVFADASYDLTEWLRFQAGVRYSWTSRIMRDTGNLDILTEPFDILDPGTFAFLTFDAATCAFLGFPPATGCGLLQNQVPSTPLTPGNVAFLLPIKGDRDANTANTTAVVKDRDWDSVTGRFRVELRPWENQLFYAGYSRGERHGGFNFFVNDSFKSETINAYEIGAKNSLFDNRMILNSTFFWYDFENRFINETQNNVTTTVNAPESQIYGIELQWVIAPTDNLQISGNVGWLHAEITSDFFSQDNTTSVSNPNGFCPFNPVGMRHGVGPTCTGAPLQNLKGNVLPRSPKWNASMSTQYVFETSAGTLTPRIDFAYRGAVFYRQYENPLDRQGSYTRADARLRFDLANKPLWIEIYAQNLEDNDKIKTQVETQLNWKRFYWLAAPQTFGIRFGWKFAGDSARDVWPL